MNDFNLIEEPWIPVIYHNGNYCRVGIKQALSDAHLIRDIAASNPMDRVSIIRFLVALLYWGKGERKMDKHEMEEALLAVTLEKVWENRLYFNLLGGEKRFFQHRLDSDKVDKPVHYLIHEIPAGDNFCHFRHVIKDTVGLCPACCALGLVRLPAFSTSGGRGLSPGIIGNSPAYLIPHTTSLKEALFSLMHETTADLGTPAWIKPDQKLPAKISEKVPLLLSLTWLPRRVWLDSINVEKTAACSYCGQHTHLIYNCIFKGCGSIKADEEGHRTIVEIGLPLKTGNENRKIRVQPANLIKNFKFAFGLWCEFATLENIVTTSSNKAVVFYLSNKEKNYFECASAITRIFNNSLITDNCSACIRQHINGLHEKQKSGLKRILRLKTKKPEILESILPLLNWEAEHRVSKVVLQSNVLNYQVWEKALENYRPMMKALAQYLSPGVTSQAVQKRRAIAQALPPNPCPKPESSSSPSTQNPNL